MCLATRFEKSNYKVNMLYAILENGRIELWSCSQ
jgi:hypothetical protein